MRQTAYRTLRLLRITRVLVKHGLDDLLFSVRWLRPYRFILALNPIYWFQRRAEGTTGQRLRRALEELGPTYIKLGQMLSTRRDLLPDEITQELARLQDDVPPFPGEAARTIVERSLGHPLDELFQDFDPVPAAAASIAQVHFAHLRDGREVAVKVRRPGIERIVEQDFAILSFLAELAERYSAEARRLRVRAVVEEYAKTIAGEMDFLREAANASQLRRNFAEHTDLLYVPAVFWDYCSEGVLVMERVHGIPISQREALAEAGIDFDQLSRRAAEIFFRQVFVDAYFHADMHPGNIFIDPDTGRFIAVDFGIMGTLDRDSQHYLAENMSAFFDRDYERVAEAHAAAGWIPSGTNLQDFETALRAIAEPIFERPLNEISVGNLLLRLFQTTRRFNMQTQPQLLLLQKTLVNVEGIARNFNPNLNIWEVAAPMLATWMNQQRGPLGWAREARENLPKWGLNLPQIPNLLHTALDQMVQGRLELYLKSEQMDAMRQELRFGLHRIFMAIVGVSLLISAAIIADQENGIFGSLAGLSPVSWVLGLLGAYILFLGWPRQPD
ncbi:MAG: 2-polyprenylphenol 6-hydroxylase [Pseudomonadota bacterium]